MINGVTSFAHRLGEEPRRPRRIRERPDAYWLAVGAVCVGAFMGQLDASIVTQAFPTLQHDFHAGLGGVQWVGLSYLLVVVSTVTAFGKLADMVGRKLLYVYGFLVFVLGSALCGVAPSLETLIAARVLQGLGAAMLQANSIAIISGAVPGAKRGQAFGIQGAAQALGLSLGPLAGGLLIALGGWRLIFFINVPVGLVGTVLGWLLIPRTRDLQERTPFDWLGLALFIPAAVTLLLAISFGNELGWGSPAIVALFASAVAATTAFLARERRTRSPMLDLRLFRRVSFSVGIGSGLLSYLVLFGTLFVVPFYLENGQHHSTSTAGLELSLMPLALGLTAPFAGRLADRFGPRLLTAGGMTLAAAMLLLTAVAHGSTVALLAGLAGLGVGQGAFTSPNNSAIMGSAPARQAGVASGVLNMTRGFGTSLGLSLTAVVFGLATGSGRGGTAAVTDGFTACMLFLAGVSITAALISAVRR